jgi:hypothetical protein
MYDLTLPPKIAKLVSSARLPKNYQEAKQVLAACDSVDQCAGWADKAAAIASYARQADDVELENCARRIRARAVRRCGELLRAFDARGGNRRSKIVTPPTFDRPSRAVVAQEAGLTEHKARAAVNIAAIPEAEFEAAIESERPPGTSLLAAWHRIPPREPVNTLTENALADIFRRGEAGRAIEALVRFADAAARCGVEAVLELLLDPDNARKVEPVRRGLAEAVRLKGALDQAGLAGNRKLKFIVADPPEAR